MDLANEQDQVQQQVEALSSAINEAACAVQVEGCTGDFVAAQLQELNDRHTTEVLVSTYLKLDLSPRL